jgi:ribonuclease BN (tRNA processing enzyme)
MKAKILGSASGMPTYGKHHAALWVCANQQNILFDCGEGTAEKLMTHKLDRDCLDSICISHFHPDHLSGIFMAIQMLYLQKRTSTLKIFLPESIQNFIAMMEYMYLFEERLTFDIEFYDIKELKQFHHFIIPIPSDHLDSYKEITENRANTCRAYSFKINSGDRNLLYTSDVSNLDSIIDHIGNVSTLIVDALHPPAQDIISLPKYTSAKIILNHGISDELNKILEAEPNDQFEYAREDKEL